jgi:hypothetical protein
MFIRPWSKESENILKQISLYGKAYTHDTKKLPKQFGIRCKEIIDSDMLDIATIRNKREKRTWFIIPSEISVIPKHNNFHFKRNKFL